MAEKKQKKMSSELPGFFKLSISERYEILTERFNIGADDVNILSNPKQYPTVDQADSIENCIAAHGVPIGVVTYFQMNGKDYIVPMANEEPSVIAGASKASKLCRPEGGFMAEIYKKVYFGGVYFIPKTNDQVSIDKIYKKREEIIKHATESCKKQHEDVNVKIDVSLKSTDLKNTVRVILEIEYTDDDFSIIPVINDIARFVDSAIEEAPVICALMTISNKILVKVTAKWRYQDLHTKEYDGEEAARRIVLASEFAKADPYRAATHRKGIMNAVSAVALATGNDYCNIESSMCSWAARLNNPTITTYYVQDGLLVGQIILPLNADKSKKDHYDHPTINTVNKLLNVNSAEELAFIFSSVGLASNFAALYALVTTGINKGHLRCHARNIAHQAGASCDELVDVANELISNGNVTVTYAKQVLDEIKSRRNTR